MKISIRYKLFLSHFFAIMLVSGSVGSFFYTAAIDNLTESLRSRLKYSAAILSNSFEASELDLLRSSAQTRAQLSELYIKKMRGLIKSNPDIAFIYVMSLDNKTPRFVLDADVENPAAIGEIYEKHIPELIEGFETLSVDSSITSDRWGSFMSGYAPIRGGKIPYLVGIDMRADEVEEKLQDLRKQGLISLSLSLLFAYFAASFLSRSLLARIKSLHNKCLEFSSLKERVVHHPGDELEGLSSAFNYMLESVQATHENLEKQVKSRTTELENTNLQLTEEVNERRRMERILKASANTDYLTGLTNRREITNIIKGIISKQTPFSIALIDIDHFKTINDKFGHESGDDILRRFARALLHLTPEGGLIARWGGEEFVLLLPNINLNSAQEEAERIRKALKAMSFGKNNTEITITASFGIAEHSVSQKWEETVKQADTALYQAKDRGRDCVMTA